MKMIVKTSGSFMMYVPDNGEIIEDDRPAVVSNCNFISTRLANGELKLLVPDLPEKASDAEFADYWKEAPDMAVEAYASKFGQESETDVPVAQLEEALKALTEADFQKDGKPKVGPLDDLLDDIKVTREMRDAWWDAR